MPVQRTPEQRGGGEEPGGRLLVSAAAGSGKPGCWWSGCWTASSRREECGRVPQSSPSPGRRRGAPGRIGQELAQALAAQPDNGHLRRQSGKLYQTQISTIHAFCTVLLRQWGHLLDVPADLPFVKRRPRSSWTAP